MTHLERIAHIEVLDDGHAAVLRQMSGARRVAMLDALTQFGRDLMLARVRATHLDWSDAECRRETARRIANASE